MTTSLKNRTGLGLLALALTACDDGNDGPHPPTEAGYELIAPHHAELMRWREQSSQAPPSDTGAAPEEETPTPAPPSDEESGAEDEKPADPPADEAPAAGAGRTGTGVTLFPADYALPAEELLPVTKAIREKIVETGGPASAEKMEAYELTIDPAPDHPLKMIPLPAGEVTLGSPEDEEERGENEGPQVTVKVEPFWIASTEVTWALYLDFMDNGKPRNKNGTLDLDSNRDTQEAPVLDGDAPLVDVVSQPTPPYTGMHFNMGEGGYNADYPAISMTHHAASKFCEWLSAHTGHFYRLPTEAEWEYAARAGTATPYSFGDGDLDDYAWHLDNSDDSYHPVGGKKPNPWGLYDMHGNAAEWVLDAGSDDFRATLPDGILNPWNIPVDRYPRITKGGSWRETADRLRSGARTYSSKNWKIIDPQIPKSVWYHTNSDDVMPVGHAVGFRVVRPLKVPPAEEMHLYWNTDWWDPARNMQDL